MRFLPLMAVAICVVAPAATTSSQVTFSKDVAPILQNNCQGCHRPGEAAPFSLLTYQEARPWAKAMKAAVLTKKMPPWFADSSVGHFKNDRTMSQKEVDTLVKWVDAGAPEGNPKDLPKPLAFVEGWNIGNPDMTLEMPQAFDIPASGTVEYQYVILPQKFEKDTWVQMAEVRPGNRALVHHVIAFIRDGNAKWGRDHQPGEIFVPTANKNGDRPSLQGDMLAGYAPGLPASKLEPGTARLIKAGSDIVLQLHYTANGKAGVDQTKVGIVLAKEPPKERVMSLASSNGKFTIPPGDPNYQVDSSFEIGHEATLRALLPHMHQRGKDFEYRLVFPTGETQKILSVPRYDFSWQLWYEPTQGIVLPKGTKVECTAHYDNSPNNPHNPDATKAVKWGDQTWEEMMIGFFDVTFPADMDPKLLIPERKPAQKTAANN
jgi:hypothetical protein